MDSDGNRVLIGLSAKETREFEVLEEIISIADPVAPFHRTNGTRPMRGDGSNYTKSIGPL